MRPNHDQLATGPRIAAALIAALVLLALSIPVSIAQNISTESDQPRGSYRGAITTEYPDWFKQSFLEFNEDLQEAAAAGKRVLLLFHQDNCPYCNAFVERNLSQKDIVDLLRQRFNVIAVNIWGDREIVAIGGDEYTEKTFAEALKVQFTPTLLFLSEQGNIALRLNGYQPPEDFRLALNYVAGERKQSYRDYLAANAPPAAGEHLNEQPFFSSAPHVLSATERRWPKPLAVFFEQKRCPNCDLLHRSVLRDPATRSLIERFKVVQLDMWSNTPLVTPAGERTTARAWAAQLGITYAPTIVLFGLGGDEVLRSEAYLKTFHTESAFDYVVSGAYEMQPSFQRYLSARADALRERGIDVDIWR